MQALDPSWMTVAAGASSASWCAPQTLWQRSVLGLQVWVWSVILAALLLIAMLAAFQQVVAQAVQQGDARRQATAARADATWRCNASRDSGQRESCHAQLAVTQTLLATKE